jgi:glycosyltransferase involved in cell wall biosynthesis
VVVDGETGWLVAAEDEPSLAAAIVACVRDPDEAARRARAGLQLVEREFSAEPMLDRIEARLRELARGARGLPPPRAGDPR